MGTDLMKGMHWGVVVGLGLAAGACTISPEPLDRVDLAYIADNNLARLTTAQEPIGGTIDVYDAIAYALKYNLDQRVELMQQAVRIEELTLASYQGLPNLVAGSGYAGRDNKLASRSVSILTGRQSLEPSTSSDRENVVGDIALSWNILDFGMSWVRARQAADQVLIQEEARRRALNRIVEDVRTAYWRAIASERLLSRLRGIEISTRKAVLDSRALATERDTSPVAALSYERELLDIRREAQRIEGDLRIARSQLAALMNLPSDQPFRLSGQSGGSARAPVGVEPRKLVRIALMNRPEIRELAYKQRINDKDAEAALFDLLPNLNLLVGANLDTNSFLYNANWVGWGARASWNLMKVFQYPQKQLLIGSQSALLDERALAMSMAIITQVHVSRARYLHARKELQTAGQLRDVQRRLLDQIKASTVSDRTSQQTLIREQMNTIVSDVRYDLAYANLQNAYGNIYASLGLDALPPIDIDRASVGELSKALRKTWVGLGDLAMIDDMRVEPVVIRSATPAQSHGASESGSRTSGAAAPTTTGSTERDTGETSKNIAPLLNVADRG